MLERRKPLTDRLHLRAPVDVAVAEAVAADGEHHLRFDLREAVDHAAGSELRRARRPDRTQARGGDERRQRLGNVRQVGDDAVAGADAEALQAGPDPGRQLAQLAERQLQRRAGL